MKSYYRALVLSVCMTVPWASIWKPKVSLRVAFFVWTATMVHILTIDNLRRRQVLLIKKKKKREEASISGGLVLYVKEEW